MVCGVGPLLALLVYPNVTSRPFTGELSTMWLVSPPAQQLVFLGFIYGYLRQHFAGYVHRHVPVEVALLISTVLFGLWHVPNFLYFPTSYVWFQLFYTGILGIVPALSRQWTGSVLYGMLSHMTVNFIAWTT